MRRLRYSTTQPTSFRFPPTEPRCVCAAGEVRRTVVLGAFFKEVDHVEVRLSTPLRERERERERPSLQNK